MEYVCNAFRSPRSVVCMICLVGSLVVGCSSGKTHGNGIDILRLSDEIKRGVNLRELVKRYGPPDVIDFSSNRVAYFTRYEETEYNPIGAIFGAESKEEFREYWSLILNTEVPRNGLMPVSFSIIRYKTDVADGVGVGPDGRLVRHGGISWSEWERNKASYKLHTSNQSEISGLSAPPKDN